MLIVYHLTKKRTTWDKFLTEEGFGSINSRRRVGRLKKQDAQEKTSATPMPNNPQPNPIHSSTFFQVDSPSMSSRRKTRSLTKKAGDPTPIPTTQPVNEAHISSSPVSSSPMEPHTLRSFMEKYKNKLKQKNTIPPKNFVPKDRENTTSSSGGKPRKKLIMAEELPEEVKPIV